MPGLVRAGQEHRSKRMRDVGLQAGFDQGMRPGAPVQRAPTHMLVR